MTTAAPSGCLRPLHAGPFNAWRISTLPVPDFGDDLDAEDEYIFLIEDFASQYEDQAIAQWEIGYPIMQQLGVRNQCTIDMTAQLNRYRGADYRCSARLRTTPRMALHTAALRCARCGRGRGGAPARLG